VKGARQMHQFESHVFDRVSQEISQLHFKPVHAEAAKRGVPQSAADVYALSFYIWGEEDDPRRMILEVSYNTTARYSCCTPGADRQAEFVASSIAEAKWNYAFWLQQPFAFIGASDDPGGEAALSLREQWIVEQELSYTDEDEKDDFERTMELGEQIENNFWALCSRVARKLHDGGIIATTFGRPIPVIVHDLDFDDRSFDHTRQANPDGIADEFLKGF
jgi:hypothetical protein